VQAFNDFNTCTLKEPDWGEPAGEQPWRVADGYVLQYTSVSHPHFLPPLPEDLPMPANEEQIIAQQWERYEARSSPDTYDMVTGVVAHANEYLGQEVMSMTPQQLYAALQNVREQIALIMTRRRGQGPRRRQQ